MYEVLHCIHNMDRFPSFSNWAYDDQYISIGSIFWCLEVAPIQQPSLTIFPGRATVCKEFQEPG